MCLCGIIITSVFLINLLKSYYERKKAPFLHSGNLTFILYSYLSGYHGGISFFWNFFPIFLLNKWHQIHTWYFLLFLNHKEMTFQQNSFCGMCLYCETSSCMLIYSYLIRRSLAQVNKCKLRERNSSLTVRSIVFTQMNEFTCRLYA